MISRAEGLLLLGTSAEAALAHIKFASLLDVCYKPQWVKGKCWALDSNLILGAGIAAKL